MFGHKPHPGRSVPESDGHHTRLRPLGLLLKQAPIVDEWSTREKLALATSVHKSSRDQNWSSVSRQLKTFAEQNRPTDWFSQKFCALQYNDMLEKIKIPKKKRGERGEVKTAQDLIVKQLTSERLDELKNSIEKNLLEFDFVNKSLEKLKDEKCDESFLNEMRSYIREDDKKEKECNIKNELWLKERNFKKLQMKSWPLIDSKQVKTPVIVATSSVEDKNKSPLIIETTSEKENVDTTITESKSTINDTDNLTTPSPLSSMLHNSPKNDSSYRNDITKSEDKSEEKQIISENIEETTENIEQTSVDSNKNDDLVEENKIEHKDSTSENHTIVAFIEEAEESITVILEQENSNDTIDEDTVSDLEATNVTTSGTSDKKSQSISNEDDAAVDLLASSISENNNKTVDLVKENIKDEPKITFENSSTILDTSKLDLSICTLNQEDKPYLNEERIIRKAKRRISHLNNTNSNVIQTRSTYRSQSQVKSEEPKAKESITKENVKISSKNCSISNEETSVDNSISEESNEVKISTNDSNPSEEIVVDSKFNKFALAVLQTIENNGNASLFFGPISDNEAEEYKGIIRREMDLNSIRKRIENKEIKTVVEFKRDLLLMFSNVMMFYDNDFYKPVLDIQKEVLELLETPSETKMRTREKATTTLVEVKNTRSKTRGSISIEGETSVAKNKPMKK